MPAQTHFGPKLFAFLRELAANNDRDWFQANKERYIEEVREPIQAFISDFGKPLKKISKHMVADPRPVGGSLFRIYRDVRFSQDKSPYKTHAAAHFRHREAKSAHTPGFYLHLEPGHVMAGAGIWRPDSKSLARIRAHLAEHPDRWRKILSAEAFRAECTLAGESLKRPPRGFEADHPLIEDLKRKDFTVKRDFEEADALRPDFFDRFVTFCRAASPFQHFLTDALGLAYRG